MGTDADVVIMGAGLAGLSAARHLHRAQVPTTVCEAADDIGGPPLCAGPGSPRTTTAAPPGPFQARPGAKPGVFPAEEQMRSAAGQR